jgi:hypothetical protein
MTLRQCATISALAAVLAAASPAAADAAAPFDGRWSVRVVADNERCDDDYSVSLRIAEGRITYGGILASASGRVRENGQLTVTVSGGGSTVKASGALAEERGSGRWQSPNCSGKWTARKA